MEGFLLSDQGCTSRSGRGTSKLQTHVIVLEVVKQSCLLKSALCIAAITEHSGGFLDGDLGNIGHSNHLANRGHRAAEERWRKRRAGEENTQEEKLKKRGGKKCDV